MDYRSLGLKVGIEIHQQLSTGKLFCDCPCDFSDDHHKEIVRRLRPTQSELGEIDRAALEESERKMHFRYQTVPFSCLVEADEEPPHDANKRAIEASLEMSSLMGMKAVDEVHFMRKIVIDGSNTGGFQRTALISTGGSIMVGDRKIGISTLCLEEDAARKIVERGSEVTYRLDRLGIPLIEIATDPDMATPEEAKYVAERIGALLRATKKVRRGIGTIREDLNISVSGGARVEIKGAQELRLIPVYVEEEAKRQIALLDVKRILRERGAKSSSLDIKDISPLFRVTKCKVLKGALEEKGRILAIRLRKFAGTLGPSENGVNRLGPELASHARVAGVKGLFHSDELPGYGVTMTEVEDTQSALEAEPEDAFVMVADAVEKAMAALARIVDRANAAIEGVPEETRDPLPDGHTVYSRPLPGKDRMYPETDVKPILVNEAVLESIKLNLPELPEEKVSRFVKEFGISKEQADSLVKSGYEDEFELLAGGFGSAQVVARIYLNTFPELEKAGVNPSSLSLDVMKDILTNLKAGAFAKEAIPDILTSVLQNGHSVERATETLGVEKVDLDSVRAVCDRLVREKEKFIRDRGEESLGPIMGLVMKELRGKVDGKVISEILRERIKQLLT
ncbi:MAG: glutamyl-tRNA(Gln) amidotransferase subunit E [Euryarchaeota archaeon RBG_19FT_COMBO_56_21]|nr:MAG: glutamyl-tRNA(Gln) amidotransferase subunit E [Euryarchaeota archaeon RBG_19FT_COMBO_56_21]